MDNGVAVADLLDLETELQNIEQGVNQLQNIPAFVEDSWPNADAFSNSQTPSAFVNSPFNGSSFCSSSDPFTSKPVIPPSLGAPLAYHLPSTAPLQPSNPWSHLSAVQSAPNFQTSFSVSFIFIFIFIFFDSWFNMFLFVR